MDSGRQITFNRYVTRLVFGKSRGSCRNVKITSNLDSGGRITFRRHITTWVLDSWYTDFIQRQMGVGTHFQYLINVPLPLKEVEVASGNLQLAWELPLSEAMGVGIVSGGREFGTRACQTPCSAPTANRGWELPKSENLITGL